MINIKDEKYLKSNKKNIKLKSIIDDNIHYIKERRKKDEKLI